ncbi:MULTISPECIES: hypothetical protein [Pseudomonas]|uniref:Uncharacterized protein n=2 Tax=Pseudomonas TaxID=286 RepID=A0A193SJS9_9PSED|nr:MULTISPECIES: hypothetical protein [Pseudomonas]KPZ11372.1 Uncharacterized protein ALO41_01110 [Pseudomonas amygdali pv. ulmi]KWS14419.1 hypothetical protein AL065_28955 [Pseudomonas amygdali pv. ulmi]CZT27366.1 hypothetical protein PCPL58_0910 [Pseudomonas cerasi]SOS16051.1 hypothetical protein PL963_00931 [Pseudomonas cerasi]
MRQTQYLPYGFVSSLSKPEAKLINTVAGIAYKRREAGLPTINRLQPFCMEILKLAADYTQQKKHQDLKAARAPALKNIARACSDLQIALQALDPDGIEALIHATNRYSMEHEDRLRQPPSNSSPQLSLLERLQIQKLEAVQKATVDASSTRSRGRGRQPQTAERWTSLEFVRLCHSQGWSNVQVANGGSESKNKRLPVPSDAVICLAAIFEFSATPSARSITHANTALRSLRKIAPHAVIHTYGTGENAYEECEHYDISLKASVSDSQKLLAELPNFIPKED